MGFFIRSAFWLSLLFVVLALATTPQPLAEKAEGQIAGLAAARETIEDAAGLCAQEADLCAAAQDVLAGIATYARQALRLAMALIDPEGPPRPGAPVGGAPQAPEKDAGH